MYRRSLVPLIAVVIVGCTDDPATTPNNGNDTGFDADAANNGSDFDITDTLRLQRVEPAMGAVAGGTRVGLQGTGFDQAMRVSFGNNEATGLQIVSFTQATVVTPPGDAPGSVGVAIELDDERVALPGAFTYVEALDPTIGFCQLQAQGTLSATAGQPLDPGVFSVVFAQGISEGAGQGANIEGELGWGIDDDYASFTFMAMDYNIDKDGLSAGDLANDEYGAAPTLQLPGQFRYVARFRTTTGSEVSWTYCDLDGSENGIAADQLGTIEVANPVLPTIGFCQLQPESPVSTETGAASARVHALVYSDGITTGAGQGAAIIAELGWGPQGTSETAFNYGAMTFTADRDGLNAGDLANDEYGGVLQAPTAGSYRYAARFALADAPTAWTYCDLDGSDNGIDAAQLGVLDVVDPAQPSVGFCVTESQQATLQTGETATDLEGAVFVAGSTPGAGMGSGVLAELVWGPDGSDPTTWSDSVAAAYKEDADGLTAGDIANDRYTASVTPAQAGNYAFAYRFSADGGTSWSYCDTDGSDGTAGGFEDTKVGQLAVMDVVIDLADACNTQFPQLVESAVVGTPVSFYGRVSEAGVTGQGSAAATVMAQLMVGPTTSDPAASPGDFEIVDATYNTNTINLAAGEDEYEAIWTPTAPSSSQFLFRFSVDSGQNWAYCDLGGTSATGGHDSARVGAIEVSGTTPDLIDFCHVWQTALAVSTSDAPPTVTVEIYENPLTVGNGGANSAMLEAEVGYGAAGTNPGLPGVYLWNATALAYKGLRAGFDNNYEYEGAAYSSAPNPGAFEVAVRARKAGDTQWSYCDTDEASADFRLDATTDLDVAP